MLADGGEVGGRLSDAVHRPDHGRDWTAHRLVPTAAAFHHAPDVKELPRRVPGLVGRHSSFAYPATVSSAGSFRRQTTTKSERCSVERTPELWWSETIDSDSVHDRGSNAGHENLHPPAGHCCLKRKSFFLLLAAFTNPRPADRAPPSILLPRTHIYAKVSN